MDKILVFGINGFTGKHFQHYINKKSLLDKFSFIGVDISIEKLVDIKYIKSDVSIYNNLKKVINKEKPDFIINFIGLYASNVFETLIEINANLTQNILEIISKKNFEVKKVLFIGSAAEYGIPDKSPIPETHPLRPINFYGLSKLIQTQIILYYSRKYNLNYNLSRTFNIIGKNISSSLSIGAFRDRINNAKDDDFILTGNLNSKRDFLDIEDVVNAYWHILMKGKMNEVYNVCLGKSYTIKEILSALIDTSGKNLTPKINPEWLSKNEVPDIFGDNFKLINDTGWAPEIDIFESIKLIF